MDGNQGAWNHLTHGEVLTAANDVVRWINNRVSGVPSELKNLEDRLTSPLGKDAYKIASDFFEDWADGDTPLQAAEKAIAKDGAQLTADLIQAVADWLGIKDRDTTTTAA